MLKSYGVLVGPQDFMSVNPSGPSGDHFNLPGHSQSDIQGLGIEHVRSTDPFILKAREALLIKKFDSFRYGLNQEP